MDWPGQSSTMSKAKAPENRKDRADFSLPITSAFFLLDFSSSAAAPHDSVGLLGPKNQEVKGSVKIIGFKR